MDAPRTFLILDDNEDNRILTAYALRKAFPGARILESLTAAEAAEKVRALHLDAVVTDHHLSEHDGAAFLHQLRASGRNCPVIMVTASSDPNVHRRAYAAGATRVFSGIQLDFISYLRTALTGNH